MTVAELKRIIDMYLASSPDRADQQVVVTTENGGIPTKGRVPIARVMPGFDWDRPNFLLMPETPVVAFRRWAPWMPLREHGATRLLALKASYEGMGFKYIAQAREQEWLDGFVEGVRAFTLAAHDIGDLTASEGAAIVGGEPPDKE